MSTPVGNFIPEDYTAFYRILLLVQGFTSIQYSGSGYYFIEFNFFSSRTLYLSVLLTVPFGNYIFCYIRFFFVITYNIAQIVKVTYSLQPKIIHQHALYLSVTQLFLKNYFVWNTICNTNSVGYIKIYFRIM